MGRPPLTDPDKRHKNDIGLVIPVYLTFPFSTPLDKYSELRAKYQNLSKQYRNEALKTLGVKKPEHIPRDYPEVQRLCKELRNVLKNIWIKKENKKKFPEVYKEVWVENLIKKKINGRS